MTGHAIWDLTQRVAVAMREAYACDGTSIRQHNEPAGGQDVWHLHVHVFARHHDDSLSESNGQARWVRARERREYADRIAGELDTLRTFDKPAQDQMGSATNARHQIPLVPITL